MGYLTKDKKRQAILEAALALAASIGFAGITARKLAEKMGAATGTIHHHFSSLEELKNEAIQYHFEITMADDLRATQGLTAYQALLQLLLPSNFINREFEGRIWMSAEDEMWRNPKLKQTYSKAMVIFIEQLEMLIQKGVESGVFKLSEPARQCALKFQALSWSLCNYTHLGDEVLNLDTADSIVINDLQQTLGLTGSL